MRHKKMALILVTLLLATQSLCFAESEDRKEGVMAIQLTSSAFKNGEMLPKKYTCDGDQVSPPLSWSGLPPATKSIAIISDDPDAPMRTFVHWVIFNIPPEEKGLPEDVPAGVKELENGARQGVGDARQIGYISPCPPFGTHRYYFKIYALDTMLALEPGATKPALLKAMEGHILAQGELIGKYKR